MRSLFLAAPVVCLAVLASPAYPATAATLVVNNAYAEDGVLVIQGGQFGDVPPYVTLAGVPLVVLSFNRTEIQAQLPDPTPPGSYLLARMAMAMIFVAISSLALIAMESCWRTCR